MMDTFDKILIIDDALFMRQVIYDIVSAFANTVYQASDIDSALDIAARECPDLATLDLTLDADAPVQGLNVLNRLISSCPGIRIVVISALDQPWLRNEVLSRGARAYVAKPFTEDQIHDLLTSILRGE